MLLYACSTIYTEDTQAVAAHPRSKDVASASAVDSSLTQSLQQLAAMDAEVQMLSTDVTAEASELESYLQALGDRQKEAQTSAQPSSAQAKAQEATEELLRLQGLTADADVLKRLQQETLALRELYQTPDAQRRPSLVSDPSTTDVAAKSQAFHQAAGGA